MPTCSQQARLGMAALSPFHGGIESMLVIHLQVDAPQYIYEASTFAVRPMRS